MFDAQHFVLGIGQAAVGLVEGEGLFVLQFVAGGDLHQHPIAFVLDEADDPDRHAEVVRSRAQRLAQLLLAAQAGKRGDFVERMQGALLALQQALGAVAGGAQQHQQQDLRAQPGQDPFADQPVLVANVHRVQWAHVPPGQQGGIQRPAGARREVDQRIGTQQEVVAFVFLQAVAIGLARCRQQTIALPVHGLGARGADHLPLLRVAGQATQGFTAAVGQLARAQQQGDSAAQFLVELPGGGEHAHGHLEHADLLRSALGLHGQRGHGMHADVAQVVGADAGHAVAVAQAVFHQGLDEPDGVAKVPRVMHAQQNPVPRGQVHEEAETVLALQVAPARCEAGVELVADVGQLLWAAVAEAVCLADQFHHPGIGSHRLGQQLGAFVQAFLRAVQGQSQRLRLLVHLQLPQRLAFDHRLAAEQGEEDRQAQAATDDDPADRPRVRPHLAVPLSMPASRYRRSSSCSLPPCSSAQARRMITGSRLLLPGGRA